MDTIKWTVNKMPKTADANRNIKVYIIQLHGQRIIV